MLEHDADGSGAAVLAALAKLATAVAAELVAGGLRIIGITGSSGKTSTKDLVAAVLEPLGEVVAPPGSFNNELGHPWTVLRATRAPTTWFWRCRRAILAISRRWRQIAPPAIGVVLNVGTAHLGEFGSREAIAQTKAELPQSVSASGAVILNVDDPIGRGDGPTVTEAWVVRVSRAPTTESGPAMSGPKACRWTNWPGRVSRCMPRGDSKRRSARGLRRPSSHERAVRERRRAAMRRQRRAGGGALAAAGPVSRHRMQVTTRADGVTVIDDAYNANPDSMRAGLQALAWIAHGGQQPDSNHRRSWAVLGEMAELGEDAITEHDRIGRLAVRLDVSRLVVVGMGRSMSAMHHGAVMEGSWGAEAVNVADSDAALALLRAEVQPGDVVLVKASNAAGLGALGRGADRDRCWELRP